MKRYAMGGFMVLTQCEATNVWYFQKTEKHQVSQPFVDRTQAEEAYHHHELEWFNMDNTSPTPLRVDFQDYWEYEVPGAGLAPLGWVEKRRDSAPLIWVTDEESLVLIDNEGISVNLFGAVYLYKDKVSSTEKLIDHVKDMVDGQHLITAQLLAEYGFHE